MQVKRKSILTGEMNTRDIPLNPDDMMLYQLEMGTVDDLMPYLSDTDRTFIMTGITDEEWQDAFADVNEDA